jgi:hypothetical protein
MRIMVNTRDNGDCPDDGGSWHLLNVGQYLQTTWCNIPEDSPVHTLCYKNQKSHEIIFIFQTPQSQTTAAFGFTPIANMTSPTPVMMSGMMSPPPMMVPTIPLYTPAGIFFVQYISVWLFC